ncbi:hypothetical protein FXO38_17284 [Capsicum annuum]|uniref:Uncharacterized protein n=1 Tax=Capsicum annuum TaxID=4072 RepID=A0A2G3AG28_CAPAN|nr:uncharacterized protein LOC107870381 isoform X2 [Capsicum annuum]KAF3650183.1 hypothetical protein FXO38_17284 [Capsicum annuum]PHT93138.1 hypothetical protein T459_01020 [Capsicum annuum]
MAAHEQQQQHHEQQNQENPISLFSLEPKSNNLDKIFSSYLGLSFAIFLGFLPKNAISLVSRLQNHNKELTFQLIDTEEQLKQLLFRRKEDSKANARVVEIFASHRHAWQQEEKRLLQQIDECDEEIGELRERVEQFEKMESELRGNVEELKREISERDEMLNFMSSRGCEMENSTSGDGGVGDCYGEMGLRFGKVGISEGGMDKGVGMEECYLSNGMPNAEQMSGVYGQNNGFNSEYLNSASKFWAEKASPWQQDLQYDSVDSLHHLKHFVARREAPWKIDGESTGVSSKLKLLEQELLNLEKIGKTDVSKVPSSTRKQVKRYQALAGKIDDLCRRMQASDPCEPNLSPEFRTQRQTEFLLEAFRLQQRASETGQKLMVLQTDSSKSYYGNVCEGQAQLATKRSFDSIRNNLKEIQRNLEIWLARIIGDLEGILSRDGASRVRDYYISRYPFVQ